MDKMPSNLCEKCRFLYFSAESLGRFGFTEEARNGDLHLQFPAGQQSIPIHYDCRDDLPDLPQLKKSAEAGCRFCALLRESLLKGIGGSRHHWVLKRHDRGKLTVKVAKLSVLAAYRTSDEMSKFAAICVEWDVLSPGRGRSPNDFTGPDGRVYFKLCAHFDDPLARYLGIAYPHPEQGILSAENVKAVRDQLMECDQKHNHASRPIRAWGSKSDIMPSRLIKIIKGQNGRKVHLVETKDLEDFRCAHGSNCREGNEGIKYVALSYRWGHDEFLTTTPSNLQEHLQDIPLSSSSQGDATAALPRGFGDVVDICCELGISYLWIDSLCIMQKEKKSMGETRRKIQEEKSRRDWATESAKMHSIYMSAYLTIFLVATDTPLQSVLERPVPSLHSMVDIAYSVESHPEICGSFFVRALPYTGELDHLVWNPFLAAEDESDSSLWNTRGWTLQERLLSPRKLYIGVTDMLGLGLLTCPARMDYGYDVEDIKRPRRHKSLDKLEVGTATATGTGVSGQTYDKANLYQIWYRIVEDYSCRDLTVSSDKLPALSGIARTHALALDDQYIVGLWAQDLAMGLLWAPRYAMNPGSDRYFGERKRKPLTRSEQYRAPSWSWCANDGQIDFVGRYLHRPRSEIEVLGHDLTPEYNQDYCGQLAVDQGGGGYVKLRAKVKAAEMQARYEPRADMFPQDFPELEQPESPETGFQLREVQVSNDSDKSKSYTIFLDHSGSYPDAEEVFLMIVARGDRPLYSHPGQYESGIRSAGLVLRKCPGQTRLQLERIGFYSHFWDLGLTSVFDDCEPQTVYLV